MINETQAVMEWIEDNYPIMMDIYLPLAQHEHSLLMNYDDVFRDSIRSNFREMFMHLLAIEFSRSTALSSDVFYSVIDDKTLDNLIYKLEDFDNLGYDNFV